MYWTKTISIMINFHMFKRILIDFKKMISFQLGLKKYVLYREADQMNVL